MAKKKAYYKQIHDGDWLWLARQMDIECCDCGLVHRVKFREEKGKVYWIVRRLIGKTRAERKRRGIIFKGKDKC